MQRRDGDGGKGPSETSTTLRTNRIGALDQRKPVPLLALHHLGFDGEPIPGTCHVDEPEGTEKPSKVAIAGSKTITRKDFDALGPWMRAAKIKDGFNLVD
jgi:hypothetical protein